MLNRRLLFKGLAAVAAAPLLNKIPVVQRVGAYAAVQIRAGAITSITITSAGSGYRFPPVVSVMGWEDRRPS